jgi:hypothetical protein
MEKYSQFRDRGTPDFFEIGAGIGRSNQLTRASSGSGIAPFLPIHVQPSGLQLPLHTFLFLFRLPLLVSICLAYFFVLQWLPIGSLGRKAFLWCILGVPSLWWVDLQVDGVKRGYVHIHVYPFINCFPRKQVGVRDPEI